MSQDFTWSYSSAVEFEVCRRKRFWKHYAGQGGEKPEAPAESRRVCFLSRLENLPCLVNCAVKESILWSLHRLQQGREVDVDSAYCAVARPFLNQRWQSSRSGTWREQSGAACLREHYYGQWTPEEERHQAGLAAELVRKCLDQFIQRVWPRLQSVDPASEICTDAVPGSFDLEGVPIIAIPDYAYRCDAGICIHEWKSGPRCAGNARQIGVYGLWAHKTLEVASGEVLLFLEYLGDGALAAARFNQQNLLQTIAYIEASVADMSEYLVDGDRHKNRPVPREEWDISMDEQICRRCNFYELCAPELEAL